MPKAMIDGPGVASETDGKARVADLVAVRDAVERAGYDATVVVDEEFKKQADDPDELAKLIDRKIVKLSPAGMDADYYVLEQCEAMGAIVVSNASYEDRRGRYPWIAERRVTVRITDGNAELDEDAVKRVWADDAVTEASKESFPASDPPPF